MPFKTPSKTSEYIRKILPAQTDELLIEIENEAAKRTIPILLPETAAVLAQLIKLAKPKKILEIGTALGYSAMLMLKNSENSTITSVEIREEYVTLAKQYLRRAGMDKRATLFVGDACEIVPLIEGEFDFIFVDGPKTRYIEFLPYLKKLLSSGGVLCCDNILFNRMVSGETQAGSKLTIAQKLDEFLRAISTDKDFMSSIIETGDGLSVSIKI